MFAVLMCILLQGAALAAELSPTLSQRQISSMYDSLSHPILDGQGVAEIAGVSLQRGGQEIIFSSGAIRFFAPVHGRIYGAVFLGSGFYVVAPPTEIERLEFVRKTGNTLDSGRYRYEFQRAVLWFADSVFEELRSHCRFREEGVARPERDAVNRSVSYATDPWNDNSLFRILQEMLEARPQPYLLADFLQDRGSNDLFLEYDMRRFEEVRFSQPSAGYSGGFSFSRNPVCAFHLPEEYAAATEEELSSEDKRRVTILDTKIDVNMENRENLVLTASVHFRPVDEPVASVSFYLYPGYEVKEVKDASGKEVSFLRVEKGWQVLVVPPKAAATDDTLTFAYEGTFDILGWVETVAPTDLWYPETEFLERSNFEMTYRVPKELTVVSAGRKVSETADGKMKIVKYSTKDPTLLVSFSAGEYHVDSLREFLDEPLVKGYYTGTADIQPGLHDLAKSIHLFTNLFGKISYDEFDAVNGPWGGGQSFQQLLHLPYTKESVKGGNFSVTLGRAHEVSHAWWGHAVGWRSYHDQWLSEGFAHYSALLHALYVLRQDEPFFDKLREWKEDITGVRKYAFGSGPAAGSIWLGYRSSSAKTREDPELLIYKKGAWIVHMLRMLMMDLQTFREDAFKAMMKDFYVSFSGLNPGTIDFQHTVEKYTRVDMSWFFHEWVYLNDIPTYHVKHTFTKNAEGKWIVAIDVQQTGVPETFKMFVPIEIKLKDGTSAFSRLFIDAPSKTFSYELDNEPSQLVFNRFEAVLCTVKE